MRDDLNFPIPLAAHRARYDVGGPEGNAFSVMASTTKIIKMVLREVYEMDHKEINAVVTEYRDEAMDGDYNNLLRVSKKYVAWNFINSDGEEFDPD